MRGRTGSGLARELRAVLHGGDWVEPRSAETIQVTNPFTGKPIASAGHMLLFDEPGKAAPILERFLAR